MDNLRPADVFRATLPRTLPTPVAAEVFAPSNIALSKYWGKRDFGLNLPLNSSVSISLGRLGTLTRVAPAEVDQVVFQGEMLAPDAPFARKIRAFVDLFRGCGGPALRIETENTIPTAAGLASSASGFAALTLALDQAFGTMLPKEALSMLARLGSGSAARSIWHGFVHWDRGR
ncbi:MAG: diphosphomevalonate decarboxylase, partial [Pseudomonadota bacterium]